ncbi:MAG: UbiA family prenyltransferase [Pseudomonadota bacterium]
MTLGTLLRLGRVSNLPTVWTNALAGAVLSGASGGDLVTIVLLAGLALTLFYEGGMWLNDAFDAEIDAHERANRPIPNGEIGVQTVFAGGFAMLAGGIAISFAMGTTAGLAGIALAVSILAYDALHKKVSFGPVLMGATRFLSYALAAVAVGTFAGSALWGALGLFAYIIGVTYAAKQEAYDRIGAAWPLAVLAFPVVWAVVQSAHAVVPLIIWAGFAAVVAFALHRLFRRGPGDVPKAVVTMIAGISLYDAALIASTGAIGLGVLAAAGFALTLALQRVASGT